MPYQNKWNAKGLHRKFTGTISGQEILLSNLTVQGDERFDNIQYIFNDFTQIEGFEVTEENITLISTIDHIAVAYNEKLKIIIVADNEEFLTWARLYLTQMEDTLYKCAIFKDVESALKSLP